MKNELRIANIRGTVFAPKVNYNPENLHKMQDAFPGYMPSMISPVSLPEFVPGMGVFKNNSWRLVSADQMETISFFDDKIDIIVNCGNVPYSAELVGKYSARFLESFTKILRAFTFKYTRLAIAPTVYVPFFEGGEHNIHDFTKKIFAFHQFMGSELDNCDFSQVFRVKKSLNGTEYLINLLTRFASDMIQEQSANGIRIGQRLNTSMDINTYVNPEYSFGESELNDFFNNSPVWCEDLLNGYFSK